MTTLRDASPLSLGEIVAVFTFVATETARLHAHDHAHGALGIDDITATRLRSGDLEVSMPPRRHGASSRSDDVAAIGASLAATVQRSCAGDLARHGVAIALVDIAAQARRAAVGDGPSAEALARMLAALDAPATARDRTRWRLRLFAWITLLVAAVVALPEVAPHVSSPPLFRGGSAVGAWWRDRDVATAVVGALRLVVHALAVYLLATTIVTTLVQALPSRSAHRLRFLDALAAAPARRLAHAAFGVSLTIAAATTVRTPAAPSSGEPTSSPATVTSAPTTTFEATAADAAPVAVLAAPAPPHAPAPAPEPVWVVAPGDSFWRIAERHVEDITGRRPTEHETRAYWLQLIEANRDRLRSPDVPDLLFSGQVLRLPRPAPGS